MEQQTRKIIAYAALGGSHTLARRETKCACDDGRIQTVSHRRTPLKEAIKRKSQFINQADRGSAIYKSRHNLHGTTTCLSAARQKKRGDVASSQAEPALRKFSPIFGHNDTHWINASID
jgi:hypothetical protein